MKSKSDPDLDVNIGDIGPSGEDEALRAEAAEHVRGAASWAYFCTEQEGGEVLFTFGVQDADRASMAREMRRPAKALDPFPEDEC